MTLAGLVEKGVGEKVAAQPGRVADSGNPDVLSNIAIFMEEKRYSGKLFNKARFYHTLRPNAFVRADIYNGEYIASLAIRGYWRDTLLEIREAVENLAREDEIHYSEPDAEPQDICIFHSQPVEDLN